LDKNINLILNLNHKYRNIFHQPGENLIYGEHSELAREILDTSQCTNLAQRLRDFGRFEMNKCDLGRQREDRILAAEEDIPYETHESLPAVILINVWGGIVENHFVGPYVLPPPHYVQNGAQKIRETRGILNRVGSH
jgi:hypothetical protein